MDEEKKGLWSCKEEADLIQEGWLHPLRLGMGLRSSGNHGVKSVGREGGGEGNLDG